MGAAQSLRVQNQGGKRKYLTSLLKGVVRPDGVDSDFDVSCGRPSFHGWRLAAERGTRLKTSRAADAVDEILELVFRMLLQGSRSVEEDAARLDVVSRVNRHWVRRRVGFTELPKERAQTRLYAQNDVGERLLYQTVELTNYRQLCGLLKTLTRNPNKRKLICHLRIPDMIPSDLASKERRRNSEPGRREEALAQARTNEMVIELLSLPT